MKLCPICGKEHEIVACQYGSAYCCGIKSTFILADEIAEESDYVTRERWFNAIYNYVLNYPMIKKGGINHLWKFYYDETESVSESDVFVNVYQLMKNYPVNVMDRMDRIIVNLSKKYPLLSDVFKCSDIEAGFFREFYCESKDRKREILSCFSALLKLNYIETATRSDTELGYRIAIDGWKRVSELMKNNTTGNYGFIAMSFDDEVKYIERSFKQAIQQAGFEPRIIKDKEHNNYIMPEIFYEIKQSKFVVVDVTKQNNGAYYEAGYAQALGKEVIVCCKKEVFDSPDKRPHFDIAQKSMIIWQDENELIERLQRRIKATVN